MYCSKQKQYSTHFRYSTKPTSKTIKGSLKIGNSRITDAFEITKKPFSFAVIFGAGRSQTCLMLAASSLSQKQEWMTKLSEALVKCQSSRSTEQYKSKMSLKQNRFFQLPTMVWNLLEAKCGDGDGFGVYTQDGSRYEGSWQTGVAHGQGTHRWSSGLVYSGEWKVIDPYL